MQSIVQRIQSIIAFFKEKPWRIIFLIIVVGGIWFFFFRGSGAALQTLVVHRQDFTEQVAVSGTVEASDDASLGFSQSGRVTHLYVKVGDTVRAGAIIAEVENGDLRAAVLQKQAALQTAEAKLASLQAGTRPEEIAIAEAAVASDEVALSQTNQALLNAVQNGYSVSGSIIGNTVDQFFTNPHTSSPNLAFALSNYSAEAAVESDRVLIESVLSNWSALLTTLSASSALESIAIESQQNLSSVLKLLTDANTALNYAVPGQASASTISGWVTDVGTARATVNTAISTLTSAVTSQKAASAALTRDQKDLALKKAGTTKADIDAQVASVASASADVLNAQAQLAKTIIIAPFAGVITKLDAKIGEIASPTASEITLQSAGIYHVVTYIPEVNVASIAVGNDASVTLDAYGPDTPFKAKIIAIDPAETVKEGISTYKTTLMFDEADLRIKSGMTASVSIFTKVNQNVVVIPQGAVHSTGAQSFVTKSVNGTLVETAVTVGATSALGQVEIFSGLEEGDVVAFSATGS